MKKRCLFLMAGAVLVAMPVLNAEDKVEPVADRPAAGLSEAAPLGQPVFQPITVDPTLVRRSMQARSDLDSLNRRIQDRQSQLYAENERIRELQTQLGALQAEIDALMDKDEELQNLRQAYKDLTPAVPMGPTPVSPPTADKDAPNP